jgi:hypothetical protein
MTRPRSVAAIAIALACSLPTGALASQLDEAVETMLSERESPAKLEQAIAAARKLGASDQSIIEARFLFHVDRREDDELAAMLPAMLGQAGRFKLADSEIFAVEEDWLAVVEYVKSLAALEKKDLEGFKKHITEAFWLSPGQAAAFAPHIERVRLDQAMKKVTVDQDLPLSDLNGKKTRLAELRGDAKAMLLHFFSPWSRECEDSIDDLRAVHAELLKHRIPLIGIVGGDGGPVVADTAEFLASLPKPAPGAWLADHPESPLGRLLRVTSAPTMVLVDDTGKVLFNGHPADPGLWQALSRLAPGLVRPATGDAGR